MLEFFSDCNIDLFLGQLNHAAVPGAAHFLQLKRLFQTVNFFGLIESFVCRGGGSSFLDNCNVSSMLRPTQI